MEAEKAHYELLKVRKNGNKENMQFSCKCCHESFNSKQQLSNHIKGDHPKYYQCKECDHRFKQSSELELHLITEHSVKKKYSCDVCKSEFVFKWRLQKHIKNHNAAVIKTCHFFNNKKTCPFSKIGCTILHQRADKCKFSENSSMSKCQFRHE